MLFKVHAFSCTAQEGRAELETVPRNLQVVLASQRINRIALWRFYLDARRGHWTTGVVFDRGGRNLIVSAWGKERVTLMLIPTRTRFLKDVLKQTTNYS